MTEERRRRARERSGQQLEPRREVATVRCPFCHADVPQDADVPHEADVPQDAELPHAAELPQAAEVPQDAEVEPGAGWMTCDPHTLVGLQALLSHSEPFGFTRSAVAS